MPEARAPCTFYSGAENRRQQSRCGEERRGLLSSPHPLSLTEMTFPLSLVSGEPFSSEISPPLNNQESSLQWRRSPSSLMGVQVGSLPQVAHLKLDPACELRVPVRMQSCSLQAPGLPHCPVSGPAA